MIHENSVMGTFNSFRKAYGVLKDSTKVGLAKVNSEFKDLDIAIVKATNHDECPPKERHLRRIFLSTSALRPRADVSYCIHVLSKRLAKTGSWIVALKTLVVVHRALREGDPTFREELLNYSSRGRILQISNFKDDSSPLAWDCSSWVRTYALFLEERLECFRILKYDIEAERLTKVSQGGTKVHSRTRLSSSEELLEQLPALQQLLYRLVSCQPQGLAFTNFLIQYALALVLKESFKIYCAINDGIINLVDMFFDMPKHNAVRALNIYKRASHQAEYLADFYEFCKGLDLARNFQFPTLRQSPPSFLATMEEYIREAPQANSLSSRRLEYPVKVLTSEKPEEQPVSSPIIEEVEEKEETDSKKEVEIEEPTGIDPVVQQPLISSADSRDLLLLEEINLKSSQLEENNALALSIVLTGDAEAHSPMKKEVGEIGGSSGWELALVSAPTNIKPRASECKMGGGFDKMLLDSLYEDEVSRRQIQVRNSEQNISFGMQQMAVNNHDPFHASNNHSPPMFVQMASFSHPQQHQHTIISQQYFYGQHQPQQLQQIHPFSNPFGDPLPHYSHQNHSFL